MENYYKNVQEKLMVQRDIIRSLLKDPQIIGDYYEAIIRDAIRESIPESFAVRRGVILSDTGETSRECDIIVYSAAEYGPLFLSENIVVVNPDGKLLDKSHRHPNLPDGGEIRTGGIETQ